MTDSLQKTLPRQSYLSPSIFELEWAAVFQSGWVCIGRADCLREPGDYLARRLHKQSVLVIRGKDNNLSAFYNTCRHRGAELVPLADFNPVVGKFKRSITCPYHAWTYHFDGRLRNTPHLSIDPKGMSLHNISLKQWGGFIFLKLKDTDQEPLKNALGEGINRLSRYPLSDLQVCTSNIYEVAANWKVILENYNECYHCGPVHPELCQLVPQFKVKGGNDLSWDDGVPHRQGATTFTKTGNTKRSPFPGLNETEKTHHKGELFYPNLLLSLSMDHVVAFYLWPIEVDKTFVQCDFMFHPSEISKSDFDSSDAVDFWDLVNQQDWKICESVQRGMQNEVFEHGYYAPMEDYSLDIRNYVQLKLKASGK